MLEIDALTDMNYATNMKCVVSKLPYKLRKKWRTTGYKYYERKGRRLQFKQLVELIEIHVNMAIDSLFGDLHEVVMKHSKPTKSFKIQT